MRRVTSILLGALLVVGFVAGADSASAKKKKPDFVYPTNASLGLPGPGGQNTAKDDTDPFDGDNDVISFDTNPGTGTGGEYIVGAVETVLGKRGKNITSLENQLDVSYLFIGRTCSGGSPRLQLAIDENDDGVLDGSDGNVFGYLGNTEGGATGQCGQNSWVTEDMTNSVAKWDASQIEPGTQVSTWDEVEDIVGKHRVLKVSLVDDSASFAANTVGCAYFDNLKFGDSKFKRARDTAGDGAESASLNDC